MVDQCIFNDVGWYGHSFCVDDIMIRAKNGKINVSWDYGKNEEEIDYNYVVISPFAESAKAVMEFLQSEADQTYIKVIIFKCGVDDFLKGDPCEDCFIFGQILCPDLSYEKNA